MQKSAFTRVIMQKERNPGAFLAGERPPRLSLRAAGLLAKNWKAPKRGVKRIWVR
jgi:hypothetical protein